MDHQYRDHRADPDCRYDQITHILYIDQLTGRQDVHDLRFRQQAFHFMPQHIAGRHTIAANNQDPQPGVLFCAGFQEGPKVQGQIGHLTVRYGQVDHLLQIDCYMLCQFKEVGIFPDHIFCHGIADLDTVLVAVHGTADMDEKGPFQFFPVGEGHTGGLFKFRDQGLGDPVNRLVRPLFKNFLCRYGQPGPQQMQAQIDLFIRLQIRKIFAYKTILDRIFNLSHLQFREINGILIPVHDRQQQSKGVNTALHIIDSQFLSDVFQPVIVFLYIFPGQKRNQTAACQGSETFIIKDEQGTDLDRTAEDHISLFRFIAQFQAVLIQQLDYDLDISKDRVPADMTDIDQLLNIDGFLTLNNIGNNDFLSVGREELIVFLEFLLSHGCGDRFLFCRGQQDPSPPFRFQLLQAMVIQPVIDIADIIINASSGYACTVRDLFQCYIITGPCQNLQDLLTAFI